MFSRPIFRQSIRSNYVLWAICTVVLTAMLCLVAAFHDPSAMSSFMDAIKDTPMAAEAGGQLDMFSTLLGILTQTVYGFSGMMIAMVYVVVTANSLVASEVDRGSMAYTLSTPTKRTTVAFTKAMYLIISVVVMFAVMGGAGALTVQVKHHAIWGTIYTDDVKAAANVLQLDDKEVAGDLSLIVQNENAFAAGAAARGVDEAVYSAYLNQAMQRDAYAAAAKILGVTADEVKNGPSLIQSDRAALEAAAAIMGKDADSYSTYLDQAIVQSEASVSQETSMETALTDGLHAAAKYLGMETSALATDLNILKEDSEAMAVASKASGLDQPALTGVLDQAIASNEISADLGVDFDTFAFVMMNVGMLLLMFAVSGISFLASCISNLSKYSLALGAGLPFAFLVLNLMSTVNTTLEPLRFFSLMTLFDTKQIMTAGTYVPQLVILAVVGIVLYVFGIRVFKRKDLPL